ncbi:L,D-transpeptidase family protein [Candidatus Methylospira mobilis]|uniref:L,D-transpeptidase family protein n=1 Tax=Candidatus Methylospira mobilis TaxID=1808979 RepID=UPI001D172147|nr:L,D-transpeptidase family protein [Candidatus Methylospira mobilis]WNV06637.1 L,D-transpeptidase family protein [Candidatus Methylospira mobilis]
MTTATCRTKLSLISAILLCCLAGRLFAGELPIESVRVLKSEHKLQLLSANEVTREFHAVFGSNPLGHKTQEGDGKTPEGVYLLDYKKSDSAFHKAIHISYPGERDIASAQARDMEPGGLIMIHGQKNGLGWLSFISRYLNWTNGCIALSNADMDQVWDLVKEGTKIELLP